MSGDRVPEKTPMVEYIIDRAVLRPILEDMLGRRWIDPPVTVEKTGFRIDLNPEDLSLINAWLDNQIAFWYRLGYDFVRLEVSLPLPAVSQVVPDTAAGNLDGRRTWQGLGLGPIKNWDDFEQYPWPMVGEENFYFHRYICDHLPDGMGFFSCHAGGIFEHVSRLLGYENLCLLLYEQPDLVRAVTDRLGGLIELYNAHLVQLERLPAVFQGDDLGFNTQTLIPPDEIRRYFLPWHKRYAELIHKAGKKYYFHSCGRIDSIMDDLIEDVGIDAKHSFQEGVAPIFDYKKRWGDRIALLGGVDVHDLATLSPDDLRNRVRRVIDGCSEGGRFAVGSGNSIPSYIPVENYLTMLDEALRYS
jgi:uroporphyrinogen decarboxylase